MRRAILLVAVMLTAILGAASAVAYAKQSEMPIPPDTSTPNTTGPITIENHSWGGYHWARTANPFTLKLGDNVNSTWDPILATTSSDWSTASVLDTNIVPGGTKPRNCRPTAGQDEVCNAKYGYNGWLGIATIWITGGTHITQGTVKLNDSYLGPGATYDSDAWRNLVSCQEVGHTLGLDHQDENFDNANLGTCMDYTRSPASNQHPNQGDFDELLCIYDPATNGKTLSTKTHSCTGTGHLDSFSTVGASTLSPKPPTKPSGNTPSEWGREVYRSADGRVSLYELDLGKGQKVLTWVRWTEEEAKRRAQNTGTTPESTTANSPEETTASKEETTTAP